MNQGVPSLTEREKDTLRLLVAGHDAKSIARQLDLSVHTINERLRDARRKLNVSSSREAARLLLQSEAEQPEILVDKTFGVSPTGEPAPRREAPDAGRRLIWFAGGMFVMSLLIAAVVVSALVREPGAEASSATVPAVPSSDAASAKSLGSARAWLALLDGRQWDESWREAAPLFNAQIAAPQWGATIASVRNPLGAVRSRQFIGVTKANTLPGAPAGDYEVLQFRTVFAQRPIATETVTLMRIGSGWKVAGYFIR